MSPSVSHTRARSEAYQKYMDDCNNFSNILVGFCAGKSGLDRIQRQTTLKYFENLSDPNESNDRAQDNKEVQLLKNSKIGVASRYTLSRGNSNFSGTSSYQSAQQYQHPSDENVAEKTYYTQTPTAPDVPGPNALYSMTSASRLHDETGLGPTAPIPIPRPRPRRHFLEIDRACAQAAECDRLLAEKQSKYEREKAEAEAKLPDFERSIGVVVKPSRLAIYLAQDHEIERWDIEEWVKDNTEAQESCLRAPQQPLRQCKEHCMMNSFNELNVHRQACPEEERQNKNMAVALDHAQRNARPLAARRMELAREEEARILRAQKAEETSMAAKAHKAEQVRVTAEARMAREARIAQAYKDNATHNSELSQLAEEVSNMHFATDAAAPQAVTGLGRAGKPQPRNPRNVRRGLVSGNMRKGVRMVAAARVA